MTELKPPFRFQIACMLCEGGAIVIPLRRDVYAVVTPAEPGRWVYVQYKGSNHTPIINTVLDTEDLMETLKIETTDKAALLEL